jgi:hypothetical protein
VLGLVFLASVILNFAKERVPWWPTVNRIVVSIVRLVMAEKQTTTFHPDQLKLQSRS